MQSFLSIKGLFEACSRVAIQAITHRNQSFTTAKSAFLYAVLWLTLPMLALGQINPQLGMLNFPPTSTNLPELLPGKKNVKTANRLISSRTANVVTSCVFTSTAPTSVYVNNVYDYLPTASNTNDLVGVTSSGTIPSWLNFTPSGNSTRNIISTNISNVTPGAITQDANGNVYVAENYPSAGDFIKIHKITTTGTVSVFCTIPNDANFRYAHSYGGLVIVGNYLYAALYDGPRGGIVQFDMTQNNPVGQVIYNNKGIMGLTYHNGSLYASAYAYNEILKIVLNQANPSASNVTTYITNSNNLSYPWGLCFNSAGDLYVSNFGSSIVSKFDKVTLNRTEFANTIRNTQLEIDSEGNFYLGSWNDNGIRKYNSNFSSFINLNEAGSDRSYNYCFFINSDKKLFYTSVSSQRIKSVNLQSRLTGTPSASDAGTYPITLSATDGTTTATQSFNIVVSPLGPNAPTGVVATLNSTSVDVSFTRPANNGGSAITGYTVTSSPAGLTGTGTSSPIRIPGAPDNTNFSFNTNYTFTVTATNAQGTGAASAASNAIVILDTDGDGVVDAQELIDNTNPYEPCDYVPAA